jgi:GTPase SAR1 family protein
MGKKIIFVGPPSAGKTTLRKVFLEGESALKLLEKSLEPTFGKESIVLNLKQKIGVFDLSGQEYRRWFETDERSIFYDTSVIVIIIDIRTPVEDILEFVNKLLILRNEITPSALVFLLIHKRDLVDYNKCNYIKSKVKSALPNESPVKFFLTSIKKQYFLQCFSVFIKILSTCLRDEKIFKKSDFNLLGDLLEILFRIDQELIISEDNLHSYLNRSDESFDEMVNKLNGYLDRSIKNGRIYYSLTPEGNKICHQLLDKFFLQDTKIIDENLLFPRSEKVPELPPILGLAAASNSGKPFLIYESIKGVLSRVIKKENKNPLIDVDLVPPFLSALKAFSKHFNFQNLSGLIFRSTNVKLYIFDFENYIVTFFLNPNTNIKSLEGKIYDFFSDIITTYEKKIEQILQKGEINAFPELNERIYNLIEELNNDCKKLRKNHEFYEIHQAEDLYVELENLYNQYEQILSLTLEKIKKLKVRLMKAVVNEDLYEIKSINSKIQDLKKDIIS